MSRPGKARSCPRTPKGPNDGTKMFHFWSVNETGMRPMSRPGQGAHQRFTCSPHPSGRICDSVHAVQKGLVVLYGCHPERSRGISAWSRRLAIGIVLRYFRLRRYAPTLNMTPRVHRIADAPHPPRRRSFRLCSRPVFSTIRPMNDRMRDSTPRPGTPGRHGRLPAGPDRLRTPPRRNAFLQAAATRPPAPPVARPPAPAPAPAPPSIPADVLMAIQIRLDRAHCSPGGLDGRWGLCRKALAAWHRKNGHPR